MTTKGDHQRINWAINISQSSNQRHENCISNLVLVSSLLALNNFRQRHMFKI